MLAIIIPYFKLTYFEVTLQSLANQTAKRFKVYIGDDASPEDCSNLILQFESQFDLRYHRFETNIGSVSLTQQWDRCIALSKEEEWLMILGDDDYLGPNVIESWYKNFNEFNTQSTVIRFASKAVNEKTKTISSTYNHPKLEKASNSYFRRLNGLTRSALSEYVFSRKTYMKYKFYNFPLAWHSDDMAWLDFSDNKPILSINEADLFIRVSDISISGKQNNLDKKNLATQLFYENIVKFKIKFFTKEQKKVLFLNYEIAIKRNRKLNNSEWKCLFRFYFFHFQVMPFFKLIRRFIISQIK